jgi:hypothetical protein
MKQNLQLITRMMEDLNIENVWPSYTAMKIKDETNQTTKTDPTWIGNNTTIQH